MASRLQRNVAKNLNAKPRVSSPLAGPSTSYFNGSITSEESDSDDEEGEDSSSDSEEEDAEEEGDDSADEDDLESLLEAAKENARRREAAASAGKAASADLEFDNELLAADEDALPAVYTQPADPATLFATAPAVSSHSLAKGKHRELPTTADHSEEGPILAGVNSKWGELPRKPKTKSEKGKDTMTTSGKGWFDMPRRSTKSLSSEEKREIQALRLSGVMDPKRFMRGESKREAKKMPEYFQMGYVIESGQGPRAGTRATTTKIKKGSFLDNLTGDDKGKAWAKRKYAEVQEKGASGGKGHYKKRMKDRKSDYGSGRGGGKKTRH